MWCAAEIRAVLSLLLCTSHAYSMRTMAYARRPLSPSIALYRACGFGPDELAISGRRPLEAEAGPILNGSSWLLLTAATACLANAYDDNRGPESPLA